MTGSVKPARRRSVSGPSVATPTKKEATSTNGRPSAPPSAPPPFDVKDVRKAIPEHCFERNAVVSLIHLAKDLAIASAFFYAATYIPTLPFELRCVLWPIYWFAQGAVLTGVWVLAHECGHQAFSSSKFINDTVGWFCHSALLVPYHSWRISHAAHHKNTCSMEHDEVFVPSTRSMFSEMIQDTPLANAWGVFVMFTFGW
jgi:omega-6 fatty acid desaturase (delta-12 desaturase)